MLPTVLHIFFKWRLWPAITLFFLTTYIFILSTSCSKSSELLIQLGGSDVRIEVVVDLIDCNPWFTSQHNNSMRRFSLKTNHPLDDSERKWKQKDWLVKQRWYIYVVSKLQILANVQIYSHIITLAQNLNFQTDTNLSDVTFSSKFSLVTKLN